MPVPLTQEPPLIPTQELAASALTDLLFEEPGVGRCLVAPDGSVLRANGEWLRSTGLTMDEALGADVVALFPGTRDMALAMHARARAGHRVEVPLHAQRVHGRETWWEGSIAPVPMTGGVGLLITAREITPSAAVGGGGTTRPPGVPIGRVSVCGREGGTRGSGRPIAGTGAPPRLSSLKAISSHTLAISCGSPRSATRRSSPPRSGFATSATSTGSSTPTPSWSR